jgi:type VI secretion system protein ImpJ
MTELPVVAALAHESEVSGNVGSANEPQGRRFLSAVRTTPDSNTGGSPQEVEWARPNFRILLGSERVEGFTVIRIAELVRTQTGQVIVRDNYFPPVLDIAAAPFLHAGLRRVANAIAARQRELASDRRLRQADHVEFHSSDARKFWLLHSLNGALPRLLHLLDTPRVHPEEAYLALVTLIGQLSTFDANADPSTLPKFNHLALGDAFEVLFARVLSLLSGGIERRYVEIPLEHRPDGMFIGKFPDPALSGHELFVGVRAPVSESIVRERLPIVLKLGSWGQIYDVVKQARHGVRVEIEWQPSGALPLQPGVCFFRVQRKGPYWDDIVKTSSLAFYLPKETEWANAALSVYAVDSQHLR